MKFLNFAEIEKAPAIVQFIWAAKISNTPIGYSTFEKAVEEHPQYFPEEIEYRKKWASIPQSVHDEYEKERKEIHLKCFELLPESKGISGWINDIEGYNEWSRIYDECSKKEEPLLKKLHKKYYSKYGI